MAELATRELSAGATGGGTTAPGGGVRPAQRGTGARPGPGRGAGRIAAGAGGRRARGSRLGAACRRRLRPRGGSAALRRRSARPLPSPQPGRRTCGYRTEPTPSGTPSWRPRPGARPGRSTARTGGRLRPRHLLPPGPLSRPAMRPWPPSSIAAFWSTCAATAGATSCGACARNRRRATPPRATPRTVWSPTSRKVTAACATRKPSSGQGRVGLGVGATPGLVLAGYLAEDEAEDLEGAVETLWLLRHRLHYVAGRRADHSTSRTRRTWPLSWRHAGRTGTRRWRAMMRALNAHGARSPEAAAAFWEHVEDELLAPRGRVWQLAPRLPLAARIRPRARRTVARARRSLELAQGAAVPVEASGGARGLSPRRRAGSAGRWGTVCCAPRGRR